MSLEKRTLASSIVECIKSLEYSFDIVKHDKSGLLLNCPILLGNEACNLSIEWKSQLDAFTILNHTVNHLIFDNRSDVYEHINWINSKIKIGAFFYCSKNESLIFRNSFLIKSIDQNRLRKNIDLVCLFMDRYLPEIRKRSN